MKRMWIRASITGFFSLTMLLCVSAGAQESVPLSPCFDFSLAVGKTAKQRMSLPSSTFGDVREYTNTFFVETREHIRVQAGEFDTFRVVWIQENDTPGPMAWKGERARYWCSPDLRMVVKMEMYAQGAGYPFRKWELKGDPQTGNFFHKQQE